MKAPDDRDSQPTGRRMKFSSLPVPPGKRAKPSQPCGLSRNNKQNLLLVVLTVTSLFPFILLSPPEPTEFAPKPSFELNPTAPTASPFISVVLRTWSQDAAQANIGLDSVVKQMKSHLLEIVVVTDENSKDRVRSDLYEPFRERHPDLEATVAVRLHVEPTLFGSGLLQQKYSNLMADTYTAGSYVFHLDSDASLLQWDDDCYMKDGLPVNDFAPFDYIAKQGFPDIYGWKKGTELVLGIEEETYEFNRLNQHVYPRELYAVVRDRVKSVHNVSIDEVFHKLNLKASEHERIVDGSGVAFFDFNVLGAASYHFAPELMHQHDLSQKMARWRKVCVTYCSSRALSEGCCKTWVQDQSLVSADGGFPKAYFEEDYCTRNNPCVCQRTQKGSDSRTTITGSEYVDFLSSYKNVSEINVQGRETPVFWHVPKAGGTTIERVMSMCHRLVMAAGAGVAHGHKEDTTLAVFTAPARHRLVNIDPTTLEGISKAVTMGFPGSGSADAIVTSYLHEAKALLTQEAPGRLFTVLRHPIDRALSMFRYLGIATWERTYRPELQNWTLEEYADSDLSESNWMTRMLANRRTGELSADDLQIAKDVLRDKVLIGLMDKMEETVGRIERFFGWKYRVNPDTQKRCRDELVQKGANVNKKNAKQQSRSSDKGIEKLAAKNKFDIELYDFAVELFREQAGLFRGSEREGPLDGATCCTCESPTFPPGGYECPDPLVLGRVFSHSPGRNQLVGP